jgi:signal transduction histidine kinase/ActR/RegA family two-component response regulator
MPADEERYLAEIRERLDGIPDPAALLERLFAFAPVAFQLYRADGECVLTNQAFRELFGAPPPPGYNVFRDEIVAERGILPDIRRAFAGERVEIPTTWYDPRELRHVSVTEGRRVAIAGSFFPLRDRDGKVAFVAIVFRDLTKELLRQEQTEDDAQRVAFLGRASEVLSSSLDYEVTLRAVTHAAVPEFADWCFVDLLEGERVRRVEVAHADPAMAEVAERVKAHPASLSGNPNHPPTRALRDGRSVLMPELTEEHMQAMAHDADHAETMRATRCRSLISVPLIAGEHVLGSLTVLRSKSRRRFVPADLVTAEELAGRAALSIDNARLYSEARRTSQSLEEASRAKDAFLAMLGHELRNPLSPIVTALELMRLRGGDTFARERAVIERQVEHLTRLVDDLLDMSRITRGKIELRKRVVEVAEIVAKAIETASPLLEQRAHRLVVGVPTAGLAVEGDETRLAQVVTNLLTNAAKYTDPDGKITIAAARAGDAIEIRVRDTGAGIAPDLLPHVFDLFVQGRRALDRSQGGLGLGLAIVRSLVDMHGGSVSASSDGPGRGSEFVVRLPAAKAKHPVPETTVGVAARRAHRARCVLVVDDNEDAAHGIAAWLKAQGHTVRVAFDGPSALRAAAELRPEIALLDIGLPLMDGYELAGRLRALPSLHDVKLVAITGYGQDADRARSAAAGFEEHLVKPVMLERIAALVDTLGAAE